jgi:DNA primase large subunit
VVVDVFRNMPDLTDKDTRQQVVHSAMKGYKHVNCQKLKVWGMCPQDCGAKNPAAASQRLVFA